MSGDDENRRICERLLSGYVYSGAGACGESRSMRGAPLAGGFDPHLAKLRAEIRLTRRSCVVILDSADYAGHRSAE